MEFWRQLDIADPSKFDGKVTIIGCGGIGSPVALALTKMGVGELELWDDDIVEPHNLPNQLYRLEDLYGPKVEALKNICELYADVAIRPERQQLNTAPSGVVVSGVDSMQSRKIIWEKVKLNPGVARYIDGRMAAEVGMVLSVDPMDRDSIEWYENTLFSDDEAEPAACTSRAIIYNTFMLASLIAHSVKQALLQEEIQNRKITFDFVTVNLIKE